MKKRYEQALKVEALVQVEDEDIDFSDIPELDGTFFEKARLIAPNERKQQLTIRFDPDIVQWFKAQGKGYQSRMNAVLRAYVDAHRR
ncbi:BrnA antitoxin family protein [Mesorhizobium sp. RP14(2022)]|uniref:BrnA antitoxin family protein n=1 Tax=Mesorhizobium liriopis TaxID=2953882 RepID=A0ABT1C9S7_9HYPH|nr:BrnA antitoxin family protein [Mesorhizobium liriopis]MCO6051233.1 BrnA antitoxin family protein [Mesorhizobium liriopis]